MVDINGTQYKLCLLDTNAVSEMIKNRQDEFQKYMNNLFHDGYLPCFTVFTIVELRQKQELFSRYLDIFSIIPSIIVKGHGMILEEEIENYPSLNKINPIAISLVAMEPYQTLSKRQTIELLFRSEPFVSYSKEYLANRNSNLNEMIANSKTFQAEKGKYSEIEIWIYLHTFVLLQLYLINRQFVEKIMKIDKLEIDIKAFPSLLMMGYTIFYKFYEDRLRKPSDSDIFDILNSALVPYMDAFITERNQAEVISKIKNRETQFLSNVRILTLRDLREL